MQSWVLATLVIILAGTIIFTIAYLIRYNVIGPPDPDLLLGKFIVITLAIFSFPAVAGGFGWAFVGKVQRDYERIYRVEARLLKEGK